MSLPTRLPAGLVHVRTTARFSAETVPAGLLRDHQLAARVWARLVVERGSLTLVFDESNDRPVTVRSGAPAIIPPGRRHHVEPAADVVFALEIHREADETDAPPNRT